jgi:hypothetical protein
MSLTAQIIRIILRYLAGFLVAKGVLDAGTGDALADDTALAVSIELAVGSIIAVVTEWSFARGTKKANAPKPEEGA